MKAGRVAELRDLVELDGGDTAADLLAAGLDEALDALADKDAELARWVARVKLLEARAERAADVLNGRAT